MLEFLRLTSALAAIIAGIVIMVLWIIAAFDRFDEEGGKYKCQGCNYIVHDALTNDYFVNAAGYKYSTDLNTWVKSNRDPWPILIAFGVIVGVFWIITGLIGFIARTKAMAWIYLIAGILTYIIFVVIFPILIERITWANQHCNDLWNSTCKNDVDWLERNRFGSYEMFWGAALVGFLLGAYQIASAAYVYGHLIPEVPKPVAA